MRLKRPPRTARNSMMDYLARRDHSEKELRQKLKGKFAPEEIEAAISFGKEKEWIPESDESLDKLSSKMAEGLHRRNKGIHYINNFLNKKGLPEISTDRQLELEKALMIMKNKFSKLKEIDKAAHAKIGRFLIARGFDFETCKNAIQQFKRDLK